jgi:hypothetical protein
LAEFEKSNKELFTYILGNLAPKKLTHPPKALRRAIETDWFEQCGIKPRLDQDLALLNKYGKAFENAKAGILTPYLSLGYKPYDHAAVKVAFSSGALSVRGISVNSCFVAGPLIMISVPAKPDADGIVGGDLTITFESKPSESYLTESQWLPDPELTKSDYQNYDFTKLKVMGFLCNDSL